MEYIEITLLSDLLLNKKFKDVFSHFAPKNDYFIWKPFLRVTQIWLK